MTFAELADRIQNQPLKNGQKIIAIDGGGGAGKSTFAKQLQAAYHNSFIIPIDHFYRPSPLRQPVLPTDIINKNFDWDRFYTDVMDAAVQGKEVRYQMYDNSKGDLSGQIINIPKDAVIIVEGVWSMQKKFIDLYDYTVWLEAPVATRLQRGLLRDGEASRVFWEDEYIPIDERYKEIQKPYERAAMAVNSSESDFSNGTFSLC